MERSELRLKNKVLCKWTEEVWDEVEEDYEDIDKECIGSVLLLDCTGYSEYPIMVESEGNREHYEEITGIPLTEEWLMRFGFISDEVYHYSLGWFVITNQSGNFEFISDGHCVELPYVHTLQNFYFSYTNGKELTDK